MVSRRSASPHGFAVVRGRGYRPKQVEERVQGLSRERDEAWERAARLTVLVREMEAEADRLREAVAQLAPQTYESLGVRARQLVALSEEEALQVRAQAQEEARQVTEAAEREARETCEAARAFAEALRAEADEQARRRLLAARVDADELRAAALTEAREARRESLVRLRDMRQRVTGLRADQESEHAERWAAAEREIIERASELEAHHAESTAAAQARLREAQQALAKEQETAGRRQESAQACAAELLAEARMQRERIGRETERLLRAHHARGEAVRAHLDRVLGGLRTLPIRDASASEEPS
jgi:hypothetical protein